MPRTKAAAEHVVAKTVNSGRDIHGKIVTPSMKFRLRSLSNVRYTPKRVYFEVVGKREERTSPSSRSGLSRRPRARPRSRGGS